MWEVTIVPLLVRLLLSNAALSLLEYLSWSPTSLALYPNTYDSKALDLPLDH